MSPLQFKPCPRPLSRFFLCVCVAELFIFLVTQLVCITEQELIYAEEICTANTVYFSDLFIGLCYNTEKLFTCLL